MMINKKSREVPMHTRRNEMLKRFEVRNFKGFRDNLVLDLSAREYAFNSKLINNKIVNKAIIYGKNGVGKSCLGIAIFDLVSHLTDKERMNKRYLINYLNYNSDEKCAVFKYTFQFGDDEIFYEYGKSDSESLVYEVISLNGLQIIRYNYFEKENNYIDRSLFGDLNFDLLVDNKLSILKYIYKNTPTNTVPLITKMMNFCENMLWYRSLSEGNVYSGFVNGGNSLSEILYESGKIREFEEFLNENDVNYKLKFRTENGNHQLYADYSNGFAPFSTLASTGTMALFLYFAWSISFDKISFLFIDEFDAFFHYEAAANIVKNLNNAVNFQCMLTSHNTYLMQNKLTRPDCCFIMTENKISSLYDCTDKEIREAHNLEKMYVNGVFND